MVQSRFSYFHFYLALPLRLKLPIITLILTLVQNPLVIAQGMPKSWQNRSYQPPVDLTAPERRQEGGTRGPSSDCSAKNGQSLTALVPGSKFGATEAAYPSFFVYIPALLTQVSPLPAEFILKDFRGNEIYKANFNTSEMPGIVMINLPDQAGLPALEVDQDYQWSFSVSCQPDESSRSMEVQGWVRRVKLDDALSDELSKAPLQKQFEIYTKAGIWHDALGTLVDLRRGDPFNIALLSEWQKLLNSAGLDALTQESLLLSPKEL